MRWPRPSESATRSARGYLGSRTTACGVWVHLTVARREMRACALSSVGVAARCCAEHVSLVWHTNLAAKILGSADFLPPAVAMQWTQALTKKRNLTPLLWVRIFFVDRKAFERLRRAPSRSRGAQPRHAPRASPPRPGAAATASRRRARYRGASSTCQPRRSTRRSAPAASSPQSRARR